MKKKIMMVLALLSGCYIIFINIINIKGNIESFKHLKEYSPELAISNSVYSIANLLFGLSIIAIVLYEYIPKFKIIKHFVLILVILTYSYANLYKISGIQRASYSFIKNEIFQYVLLYFLTFISISAIVLYAFSNIILYSSTRKYARYYCVISLLINYIISWITMFTEVRSYPVKMPVYWIILNALFQLSSLLIVLYGLRETPSINYIEIKLSKKTERLDTTPLFSYDQTEEVSITTEKPAIEKQIEAEKSEDSNKLKGLKIYKRYIYIAGFIAYIATCAIYIFAKNTVNNKIMKLNWLALSVLLFYTLAIVLFLLFIDKKRNANPKDKVLKRVLVTLISVLFVIVTGYYTIYRIDESSFEKVYRSLFSTNKGLEVIYVKDGVSTKVYDKNSNLRFVSPLTYCKRSFYFDKVNKGTKYMIINVIGKYEIELYPFNNDSIIVKVNRTKGIDVTYRIGGYNFDHYCEELYEISGHGILKDNFEEIPNDMKKELLSAALSSLEDRESIYSNLVIEDRSFHRYKDVYGYAKNNGSKREYYKEGYLYHEDIINGNYKSVFNFDSEQYLQKEANYIATVKHIIELCNDDFKLKDKDYYGKHIIYIDNDVTLNGTTKHYLLELTFINQELTSLFLSHKDESFSLQTEKGNGDYINLYEYLRYPANLDTYQLKE